MPQPCGPAPHNPTPAGSRLSSSTRLTAFMTLSSRLPCDEASVRQGAQETPCNAVQKRWVVAAWILGSSLAFVDGTIVNVALPAIQRELGASVYQAQWVVES